MATTRVALPVPPVRLRSVALPVEHGGWGMLGERLLLGPLVAPSAVIAPVTCNGGGGAW